jgi:predicted DNA-binding transcriptional regulator AlpA
MKTTRQIGRLADVNAVTKLARPTIDRLDARGDFPRRLRLTARAVGWDLEEIRECLERRPRVTFSGQKSAHESHHG